MTNEDDTNPADWDLMTDDERRRYREYEAEDHYRGYLDECSPQDRARAEWEQGS